jgi:gas vesicle protein
MEMSFTKEDILDALGIEGRSSWMMTALAGFGVGCVVGATVAMLLAPKSGRELRSDLIDKGRDLMHRGREYGPRAEEAGRDVTKPPTY